MVAEALPAVVADVDHPLPPHGIGDSGEVIAGITVVPGGRVEVKPLPHPGGGVAQALGQGRVEFQARGRHRFGQAEFGGRRRKPREDQ
jgi:hypothetical protein